MARVSIGIPAYNAERYLAATLDSVLAQTVASWQAVIVNDGSTDGTEEIARQYTERDSRFQLVSQPNGGVAAARNTARRALERRVVESGESAEYFVFLDADDLWDPDALETLLQALEAAPDVVGAHSTARYMDGEGRLFDKGGLEAWCHEPREPVSRLTGPVPTNRTTFDLLAWQMCIPTPGVVLLRRDWLERVGEWDQGCAPCEDWDLFLRLSALGDFAFVDRPLLSYRKHGAGGSANRKRVSRAAAALFHKAFRTGLYPEEKRKRLRWLYLEHQRAQRNYFAGEAARALLRGRLKESVIASLHSLKKATIYTLRYTP